MNDEQRAVPRTHDQVAVILRERHRGWEHRLWAGTLYVGLQDAEPLYRDHLMRYAPPSGPALNEQDALDRLSAAFSDATALADAIMGAFDPEVHEKAFGLPGEPGDPGLIQHLAQRTIDGYVGLMRWGLELRSSRVSDELQKAFRLAADMIRRPVEEIRDYVTHVVEVIDSIEVTLEESERSGPIEVTLELVVTVDPAATEAFNAEVERVWRHRR